jgi:hypothetical protein
VACLFVAGCSDLNNAYSDMAYKVADISLIDRCTHFAEQAYPQLRLTEAKTQSSSNINTTTTRIEGVNENGSSTGSLARDIAVECRFENGILTDFRWTAGPFR